MRLFFLIWLMTFLGGCQNPEEPEVYSFGEEFELRFRERVQIGSHAASIEFVDVLEDSRCPGNVTCVWAGNGKIQLRFAQDTIRLNTYLNPKDSTISNVNIQLLRLEPYPEEPVQIEKKDYRVHLLITEQ